MNHLAHTNFYFHLIWKPCRGANFVQPLIVCDDVAHLCLHPGQLYELVPHSSGGLLAGCFMIFKRAIGSLHGHCRQYLEGGRRAPCCSAVWHDARILAGPGNWGSSWRENSSYSVLEYRPVTVLLEVGTHLWCRCCMHWPRVLEEDGLTNLKKKSTDSARAAEDVTPSFWPVTWGPSILQHCSATLHTAENFGCMSADPNSPSFIAIKFAVNIH